MKHMTAKSTGYVLPRAIHISTLLGSVTAAAMMAWSSPAAAQCAVTSAPNTVNCAVNTATTDNRNDDAAIAAASNRHQLFTKGGDVVGTVGAGITVSQFGLAISSTQAGAKINVTNDGVIQVDAGKTATDGGNSALSLQAKGGKITYVGATVENKGTGGAIGAFNTVGSIAVDVTALAKAANGIGVDASTSGAGDIAITGAGSVFGSSIGINAVQSAGTGSIAVTGTGTTAATGNGPVAIGIAAQVLGAGSPGSLTVDRSGDITVTGGANQAQGVFAFNQVDGPVDIKTGKVTAIGTAFADGIVALAIGGDATNTLKVKNSGDVLATGATANGISANSNFATQTIDAKANVTADGTFYAVGVNAHSFATASITVTGDGTILAKNGSSSHGIYLTTPDGALTVTGAGATTVQAAGGEAIGILARAGGSKTITIDRSGPITVFGGGVGGSSGISAAHSGVTGTSNIAITTGGVLTVVGSLGVTGIEATSAANAAAATLDVKTGVVNATATGGDAIGITTAAVKATTTVTANGIVTADATTRAIGIDARSSGAGNDGDITVTGGGTVTAKNGVQVTGIVAVSETGSVTVTGAGQTVALAKAGGIATGIAAVINDAASTENLTVNRAGAISATGGAIAFGITADNKGTGNVLITTGAGLTASGTASATGIASTSRSSSAATTQTVTAGGVVDATGAAATGISVSAVKAATTVKASGNVTSDGTTVAVGVSAASTGGGNDGDITVTGAGAILAKNAAQSVGVNATSSTGLVTVTGSGTTTAVAAAGGAASGIFATIGSAASTENITIDRSGAVSATGGATAVGIYGNNLGAGQTIVTTANSVIAAGTASAVGIAAASKTVDTKVTLGGSVTATAPAGAGIDTGSTSGNIVVTGGGNAITGATGVNATSIAGGNITVQGGGAISGTNGTGVSANTTGAILVTGNGDIVGTKNGVAASGGGSVDVTANKGISHVTATSTGGATNVAGNLDIGGVSTSAGTSATVQGNKVITGEGVVAIAGTAALIAGNTSISGTTTGVDARGGTTVTVTGNGAVLGKAGAGIVAIAGADVSVQGQTSVTGKGGDGIAAKGGGNVGIGDVTVNGPVTGSGSGIVASTTGAAGTVSVTAADGVTGTAGAGIKTAAVGGATTINITGGSVTGGTVGVANTVTGAGNVTLSNAGILTAGVVDPAAIAATLAGGTYTTINTGQIIGTINVAGSNAATSVIDNSGLWVMDGVSVAAQKLQNNGTGIIQIVGGGTSTLTVAEINNEGLIQVSDGSTLKTTGGKFTNSKTLENFGNATIDSNFTNSGSLLMVNNAVGNSVVVTGNYVGAGAPTLTLDVDTSNGKADVLTIGGTTSGAATKVIVSGTSALGLQETLVIETKGTADGHFVLGGQLGGGLVSTNLVRQGNNWVIKPTIDGAAVTGLTNIASSVATITTSFHQPSSNFVNSKPNPRDNEIQYGIWARGDGARFTVNNSTRLVLDDQQFGGITDTTLKISYEAIQSGFDVAVLKINGSKWNAHVGVTGGTVVGRVKGPGVVTDIDAPFITGYAFVTDGLFTFDVTARHEWHNAEFASPAFGDNLGHRADGSAQAVAAVGTYRFAWGNWNVRPAAGLSYTRTHLDAFDVFRGLGKVDVGGGNIVDFGTAFASNIAAGSDEALVGRAALQIAYSHQVAPTFFISPYVSAAATRNYTNETDALLSINDSTPGVVNRLTASTTGVRDSMDYTVGIAAAETKLGVTTFVQGTVREGDRVQGGSVTVGGRINF